MPNPPDLRGPETPVGAFEAIATVVYEGSSYDGVYQAMCGAAVTTVEGCDHASLMLRQRGRTFTAAASDEVASRIDEMERRLNEGPCLDAIDDEPAHFSTDLAAGSAWPRLTSEILATTQVGGAAGFRIILDGAKVGALNIFSDTAGALCSDSMDQAAVLASFASVAITAIERGEQASTLRAGLESNREIGKAVGLLMALHGVSDDDAFTMLSRVSQDMNLKLAAVARQVIDHHRSGSGPGLAPPRT